MAHNHAMAAWVQQLLCEAWNVDPISPLDGSMLGSMATVPLPAPLDHLSESQTLLLQQRLYTEHQLEVPIVRWGDRTFVRPCCQVYNSPADYQRLSAVIDGIVQDSVNSVK
jgi:isopenicillin-N epimerase